MDESLKARLIGAAVLVAVAVLLIPELLSGRKTAEPLPADHAEARGTRTFTIELNGASPVGRPADAAREPRRAAPAAVAEQAAATPPAAATASAEPATPAPAAPRSSPAVAKAPPATPVKPPVEAAPAQAPAKSGGWVVQVGAFGSAAAAQRLRQGPRGRRISGLRLASHPLREDAAPRTGRARGGPDDANRLAERLKGRGLPTAVVAND